MVEKIHQATYLSDNAISSFKKVDLVQQNVNLKGKVLVDSDLRNLCAQISIYQKQSRN